MDENKKTLEQELLEKAYIKSDVIDQEDGTYLVKYSVKEPCAVQVHIKLRNERGEL